MREKLKRLQICVTIVLIAQVLAGIILISITADFHRTFAVYLIKNEKQTLLSELSNMYLQGFEVLVCYSAGLCIWRFVWKCGEVFTKHISLMVVWNGISFSIVICGLVQVCFLYTRIELLQNVVESSLFEGIDLYFSNPEWKLLWDEIQYQHECCGVNGYDDWKNASWIPEEESSCETISGPGYNMMIIPYACCKKSALNCFQAYAPHLTIPNLNSSEINSNGCLSIFINLCAGYYIIIVVIMLYVLVLHMLLLILQITTFCKVKKVCYSSRDLSDKRPLIVLKYPSNVKCITLIDDDNFEDAVEDEQLQGCRPISQDICSCQELKRNIFLH